MRSETFQDEFEDQTQNIFWKIIKKTFFQEISLQLNYVKISLEFVATGIAQFLLPVFVKLVTTGM